MSEIQIKKPRRRFRQRDVHDRDSDEEEHSEEQPVERSTIEEMKLLQSLRKRPHGVSIEDLASIKTKPSKQKITDPLKLNTGGYVDIKALKREISQADDIEQIGTSFAVETNRRDEDADMLKYVEEELAKRKGLKTEELVGEKPKDTMDALYELPDHIKSLTARKKTEEMLSNQMLSGIPEVDLGIEVKIKNIEATEEAKQRLINERKKRKEGVSEFVPTNVAVNFVQHNRYNIEDTSAPAKRVAPTPKPTPLRVGDADRPRTLQDNATSSSQTTEKATDDFHYEKFKRHMRRF